MRADDNRIREGEHPHVLCSLIPTSVLKQGPRMGYPATKAET